VIYYLKDLSIAHGFCIMRMHTSTNSLKEAKTKKDEIHIIIQKSGIPCLSNHVGQLMQRLGLPLLEKNNSVGKSI
jgi:hypothetical protein